YYNLLLVFGMVLLMLGVTEKSFLDDVHLTHVPVHIAVVDDAVHLSGLRVIRHVETDECLVDP
ncbi:hypothetical protein PENTCL1PPCAC_1906, partial [Pristionchus entomophagus]